MIDFTTKQLSWLIVSATTIGGGGYMTMNQKIDELDKKIAVTNNSALYTEKTIDEMKIQLSRIEEKVSVHRR